MERKISDGVQGRMEQQDIRERLELSLTNVWIQKE
jgi:hypothetical protein